MIEDLVSRGRQAIDRATAGMPVLSRMREEYAATRPLSGARIAGCVHLTKETAVLIRGLLAAGAEVAWTGGDEVSTQEDVAAALAEEGVRVFSRSPMTSAEVLASIEATLDSLPAPPTLLIDNGAKLILACLNRSRGYVGHVRAATEKTTEGVRLLRAAGIESRLPFPVLAIGEAMIKLQVDNMVGTGQSTVDGIMRATGMLLAGKVLVVAGYGHVGRGIAARARGLGARVVVVCRRASTAVRAHLDGSRVLTMDEAAPLGDVFCTATGVDGVVLGRHIDAMKDGAVLCNAGHSVTEIDLEYLKRAARDVSQVRPHVTQFELDDGSRRLVLTGGGLVNLGAGEGNPSEVMDVTFAHQLLAVVRLNAEAESHPPGIHTVSQEEDERIAARKLRSLGIRHDRPRPEQLRWMTDYVAEAAWE